MPASPKPLDTDLVRRLAREHEVLITIEEGSVGGFASHVLQYLATAGLLDHGLKVRPMILPDHFIDHAAPAKQYARRPASTLRRIAATALGRARPADRARAAEATSSSSAHDPSGCGMMRR